jgi:hypothetical protein
MSVWADERDGKVLPAIARRVRAMFAEGADDKRIAAELGTGPRTVKRIRHALGLLRRLPPPPATEAELRTLHAEGLTFREISERTGLGYKAVVARMHRLGLAGQRGRARGERGPARGDMMYVRISDEERRAMQDLADAEGVPLSEYVRRRALG